MAESRYTLRLVETGTERVEELEGRRFTVREIENLLVVYLPREVATNPEKVDTAVHAWCQAAEQSGKVFLFAVEGETYRVEALEVPDEMKEE